MSEKCKAWRIGLDYFSRNDGSVVIEAHTVGKTAKCPCCGKRSRRLHTYRLRKIQCTEFLGYNATMLLRTRHFICTNPGCEKKIFAESLRMTHPYGRRTDEVEERLRHSAIREPARAASETLAVQHIQISPSTLIRVLRQMGSVNPVVRTSGYVGLDDFAQWKGHKYMCVIVDHYTHLPLAVFDSRYGKEITDWLRSHPEIKVVTRDGSREYRDIITAASEFIYQVSDRFHLMENLKKYAVEPIRNMLGQKKQVMTYEYPSEEEAYRYIIDDIRQMGEAKHRERVRLCYEVRRRKDAGESIVQTAKALGTHSNTVYRYMHTDVYNILSPLQRKALKWAREMARIISTGTISPSTVFKKLGEKLDSRTVSRCMRSLREKYMPKRREVREHNKKLAAGGKTVSISKKAIWNYIVTGETTSKKLEKLKNTHPEVESVIQTCRSFRNMLHGEKGAPDIGNWIEEASACPVQEIRTFAEYIRSDRNAVEMACTTGYSNGILEGTVNRIKATKRNMFNRAKPKVLRAKILFGGRKWGWNYHLN